ncbi:MAG: hypothetical protein HUU50_01755 [Candidatus Brocadiae bacterium]|nr:hypothetical protein [Candidatus Brocadiia bacterium]
MILFDDQKIQESIDSKGLVDAYRFYSQNIKQEELDVYYLCKILQIPLSLCFALECLLKENPESREDALDSISLFSLFYGLFLPLSGIEPVKVKSLFGFTWAKPDAANRDLVDSFLRKNLGLSLSEKIAFLMGDPFSGKVANIGQDTLFQVLSCLRFVSRAKLRDSLFRICDIGVLFSQDVTLHRSCPPITAKEAILILRHLPFLGTNRKKEIVRDLFQRAGKLERYFLARLILRRMNLGYEYRTDFISQSIAFQYQIPLKNMGNAIALSSIFDVAKILETEGKDGLKKLVLKPMNPVSPALASSIEMENPKAFPLFVECKYDGIRIMAHKDTNLHGRVKYAAFTRRKHDWLSMIPGLQASLKRIPATNFILDGELHGTVLNWEKEHPAQATVYEIFRFLQGHTENPIKIKYVVFDILYFNGNDLTNLPLTKRRNLLEQILLPLKNFPDSTPIELSEGFEVKDPAEMKKWFQYFCHQGHEGIIAKVPLSSYAMGERTNDWVKKKRDLYLDLVITGALWATGTRGPQGFSSYLLSCKEEKGFREIGKAEGLSLENNMEIIQRIASHSLLTGRQIESRTGSAIRAGVEISPSIVVAVRIEDIVKDEQGKYSLRDPKIVCIRPSGDASCDDVENYDSLRLLYMKKRLG